jgi:hypothetical protein
MWKILFAVALAGAAGGALNTLVSGSGFTLPRFLHVDGATVVLPGFVGNLGIGAVAALLSFCLYGPLAGAAILRTRPVDEQDSGSAFIGLTLGALAGAILVGYSGGRWVTAEAERGLNHGTAVAAAEMAQHAGRPPAAAPPPTGPAVELLQTLRAGSPLQAYEKALSASPVSGVKSGTSP